MSYYRREILKNYYSALNGNITINGSSIYVGTGKIPESEKYYIQYQINSDNDISTFDSNIREIVVNLTCVTWQPQAQGNGAILDSMVSQVQALVTDSIFNVDGWTHILFTNEGVDENQTESEEYDIMFRQISFRHIIEED